jgi:uncharacterized protein YoxC
VPAEGRTEEQIRGEITTERDQLVSAIADLREDINAQRKTAEIVGAAVATALAAVAALKTIRRFRRH